MPSASVSTATAVKPGFFSNWRKANLRSFITQGLHWIDFRRLPSWEIAREYCRGNQEPRGNRNGDWVYRWQPVELRGDQTLRGQHSWCSDDQSDNEDEGVLRIFYHADDFSFVLPSCFRSADMKMLSDGGLTREISFRKRFNHHCDLGRIFRVLNAERPTHQQRDAHGREIPQSDNIV